MTLARFATWIAAFAALVAGSSLVAGTEPARAVHTTNDYLWWAQIDAGFVSACTGCGHSFSLQMWTDNGPIPQQVGWITRQGCTGGEYWAATDSPTTAGGYWYGTFKIRVGSGTCSPSPGWRTGWGRNS